MNELTKQFGLIYLPIYGNEPYGKKYGGLKQLWEYTPYQIDNGLYIEILYVRN